MCAAVALTAASLAGAQAPEGGGGVGLVGGGADASIEAYLRDLGLTELLAEQLTLRLRASSGAERRDIADELGRVYAELLSGSASPAARREAEARIEALAAAYPELESPDLRLTILQARYTSAERTAESWLLRMGGVGGREEALAALEDVGAALSRLADREQGRIVLLDEQEESVPARDLARFSERLQAARRRRSVAWYLAGWCATYRAELTGSSVAAGEGLLFFGALFDGGMGREATLDRLPRRMLRLEHIARSAIGAALCEAARGAAPLATAWLDAVEAAPDTPRGALADVPARRILAAGIGGDARGLENVVAQRRASGELTTLEARLAVVLALRDGAPGPEMRRVADAALASLIAGGELGHVLELARLFGARSVSGSGFIAEYVRGVRAYEEAREAHAASGDAQTPTRDSSAAGLYRQAERSIERGLAAADAASYPEARAGALMTAGLARRFSARGAADGLAAADWFDQAEAVAPDAARALDARWQATRALLENDENAQTHERYVATALGIVREDAGSARAAAAAMELLDTGEVDPELAVDALLALPAGDALHGPAQARAAAALYEMLRAPHAPHELARGPERRGLIERYVRVADGLLIKQLEAAPAGDPVDAPTAGRARRLLSVVFDVAPVPLEAALRAVRVVERAAARAVGGGVGAPELAAEAAEGRVRLALAKGAWEEAVRLAERNAPLFDAARRLRVDLALFADVSGRWREAARAGAAEAAALAEETAALGAGLVLGDGGAELPAAVLDAALAVASEAAHAHWLGEPSGAALERALALNERALDLRPSDRGALRRFAELAEAVGRDDEALGAWRRLSAGLGPGSGPWFEARTRQLELLAKMNPARALEALRQHAVFYPEYGPAPWGPRLRRLHAQLAQGGV